MSGAVLMTVPSRKPAALVYADDMTRSLNRAAQSSLTQGQAYGFGIGRSGYAIYTYKNELWDDVSAGEAPQGASLELSVEGRRSKLPDEPQPAIVFDPAGLMPVFTISISDEGERFEITSDGKRTISMVQR